MKQGSDNFSKSAIQGVVKHLRALLARMVVYEPNMTEKTLYGCDVIDCLDEFKAMSDIIVCNRLDSGLNDFEQEKVFKCVHVPYLAK